MKATPRHGFLIALALLAFPLSGCGSGGHDGDSTGPLDVTVREVSLDDARAEHTVTALANGDLLIAGGIGSGGGAITSTEVFDVSLAGSSDPLDTVGSLNVPRSRHTATRLASGNVVAIGGASSAAVEEFDPGTGTWTTAPVATLATPRRRHVAALLNDGRVLVAGGVDNGGVTLASAELYVSAGVPFVPAAPMGTPRADATATTLLDGRVLVAGGYDAAGVPLATAEVYDPVANVWTPTTTPMGSARALHRAVRLNGTVLLTGGADASGDGLRSTELFDPATLSFSGGGDVEGPGVFAHTLTLLANGEAAIAGGFTAGGATSPTDPVREIALYRLGSGGGVGAQDMSGRRGFHGAEAIPSGGPAGSDLVVVGGYDEDGDPSSSVFIVEMYDEASALMDTLFDEDMLALGALLAAYHVLDDGLTGFGEVDLEIEEDPVFGTFVTGFVGDWEVDLEIDAGQVVGLVEGKTFILQVDDDVVTAPDLLVDFRPATRVDGDFDANHQDFDFDIDRDVDTFDGFIEGFDAETELFVEVDGDATDPFESFIDVYWI